MKSSDFYHLLQKVNIVYFYRFKFNLPNFYRTPTLWCERGGVLAPSLMVLLEPSVEGLGTLRHCESVQIIDPILRESINPQHLFQYLESCQPTPIPGIGTWQPKRLKPSSLSSFKVKIFRKITPYHLNSAKKRSQHENTSHLPVFSSF